MKDIFLHDQILRAADSSARKYRQTPRSIEHEGQLDIGYTHKSRAADELAVIPVSSLEVIP